MAFRVMGRHRPQAASPVVPGSAWKGCRNPLLWLLVGNQAAERTLEITKIHPSTQLTYSTPKAS